jgi:hypothetical protein
VAEFQWWLLIVGIVAGGGLVAILLMDTSRRDVDIDEAERAAEATWIAQWLASEGRKVTRDDVEAVLRADQDYRTLPPPDRLEPVELASAPPNAPATPPPTARSAHGDADRPADQVRDDGRGKADQDLPSAREEQAAARQ